MTIGEQRLRAWRLRRQRADRLGLCHRPTARGFTQVAMLPSPARYMAIAADRRQDLRLRRRAGERARQRRDPGSRPACRSRPPRRPPARSPSRTPARSPSKAASTCSAAKRTGSPTADLAIRPGRGNDRPGRPAALRRSRTAPPPSRRHDRLPDRRHGRPASRERCRRVTLSAPRAGAEPPSSPRIPRRHSASIQPAG